MTWCILRIVGVLKLYTVVTGRRYADSYVGCVCVCVCVCAVLVCELLRGCVWHMLCVWCVVCGAVLPA